MKKAHPVRMCIACRRRYPQDSLIRLKHEDNRIIVFDGSGRSFYLCRACVNDTKKQKALSKRFKAQAEPLLKLLKELVDNG